MPIQRGDLHFVNLNPTQGREQAGQRPILVLSIDAINRLPLVVNVRLSPVENGLPMETVFLGFQVRSLDSQRFSSPPVGRVTGAVLRRIEEAVRYYLGL